MAVAMWNPLTVLVGSYAAQCRSKKVNLTATAKQLDSTSLCDTWETAIAGQRVVAFSVDGMGDFATDQVDQKFGLAGTVFGTSGVPFSMSPSAAAVADLAYVGSGIALEYTPLDASVGELSMFRLAGKGAGGLARGQVLGSPAAAVTSTFNGTAVQLGAIATGFKLLANLHVLAASGTTPSLIVKLQSAPASNFASPTDRLTFTTATTQTAQASSVAAAVTDTWWRIVATIAGTTPSFTFGVAAGVCAV